jgi:2'-5' RNA ligase
MSTQSHYFIAIPLPQSVQRLFSIWQNALKRELSYKIWTNPTDLHITLKFLGMMDDHKRKQLDRTLQAIRKFDKFTIHVGSIGMFGNPDMPRVLWAGVNKTCKLAELQTCVEKRLNRIDFSAEKRIYRPHITLAKKWLGDAAPGLMEEIIQHYTDQREILIDTIIVNQVHPTQVPKYEPIYTYKLQGGE